eukprot:3392851-Rhodomonas_salina.1
MGLQTPSAPTLASASKASMPRAHPACVSDAEQGRAQTGRVCELGQCEWCACVPVREPHACPAHVPFGPTQFLPRQAEKVPDREPRRLFRGTRRHFPPSPRSSPPSPSPGLSLSLSRSAPPSQRAAFRNEMSAPLMLSGLGEHADAWVLNVTASAEPGQCQPMHNAYAHRMRLAQSHVETCI